MSTADEFAGGSGMEEQFFLLRHLHHDGGGGLMFHVPQHSRREKLRFPPEQPTPPATSQLPLLLHHPNSGPHIDTACANFHQIQQQQQQGFSLSLSPAAAGPLGPFTGYAAVLNRSRFLEPARLLLEEVCVLGRGGATVAACVGVGGDLPEALVMDNFGEMERAAGENLSGQLWRKTSLISMLDEIYRRYRLYYEQVQTVITSFEKVAGLSTAAPYVSMALKSMTKHFTCIKDVICNHLNHLNKAFGKEDVSERDLSGFGIIAGDVLSQKGKGSGNYGKPPVWRPQRGLPERAVVVLRAWLFEHFLHPYPTDTDKQMLAKQTGLTRNQVSNWFINARVRLWKPMVEEIHNLEMRQSYKTVAASDNQNHGKQASQPLFSSAATSASNQLAQNGCMQRNPPHRSSVPANYELPRIAHQIEEPYNFFFDDFSSHGQAVGVDIGASSGVSLTLGLHQNHGVCLPEPLQMNVAHRFGLEECSNAYILGGFEGQDRLFGKDIGGHLLHDFVG